MKTNRKAAVLALGLALLSPLAGAQQFVDSEWWKVDFSSPTPEIAGDDAHGGVYLDVGSRVGLTNNASMIGGGKQPYASGYWTAEDEDDSYVTNEYMPSAFGGTNYCLKLETQGNDLTWTPTNSGKGVITLVDADLYLVGSDTAPEVADFDENGDVQAAIFLKNELDPVTDETTNSILCVYAYDGRPGVKKNVWIELEGRGKTATNDIPDEGWYHVQVLVDYQTDPDSPKVEVYVDSVKLHARDGGATQFTVATPGSAAAVGCVQSVSFRGTGAVDNFVGKVRKENVQWANFKAVVYMNGIEDSEMSMTTADKYAIGKLPYPNFQWFYFDNLETSPKATYALSRIEIEDFAAGTTRIHRYEYKEDDFWPLTVLDPTEDIFFETEGSGDEEYQTGRFYVRTPTTGATLGDDPDEPIVIARIYYEDLPQPGDFKLTASQNVGDDPAALKFNANDANLPATTNFTFQSMIVQGDVTNVLRRVVLTNDFDVVGAYSGTAFTVTVPVEANKTAFSDKTIHVATATYAEGDYTDKAISAVPTGNGVWEVGAWVAQVGTTPYETLAAAIAAVQEDAATTTTVTLLASVDEDVTIPLGKNVELDLNGCAITNVASDTISVYGTLVLTDSSENTNGIVASAIADKAAIVNYPGGNVVIEAGTIAVPDNATYYNIKNLGRMTIEEGAVVVSRVSTASTLIANGWFGNPATDRGTTGQADTAILTINGGMFDGGKNVVKNDDYGILVIEGGSFSNLSDVDAVILNWNDTTINGGEFTGVTKILCNGSYGANSADKGVMTINGGTFTQTGTAETDTLFGYGMGGGHMADAIIEVTGGTFNGHVNGVGTNDGTYGHIAISGGSFDEIVRADYCAEGFVPVTTADPVTGLYTVKPGSIQVTDGTDVFTYGAFADAIPVHGWGATYTLLTNVKETVTITNAAEKLFVEVGDDADRTNGLEVVTTVEGDAQYAYAVKATLENGVVAYGLEQAVRTYDVTFMNGETQFATTNVAYGTTEYAPAGTPTKAQDDANAYAFDGWAATAGGEKLDPLPAVTGPTNFYAVFTATPRVYTITWNIDGAETTSTAAYNTTPACPVTPAKPDENGVAFTFVGWAETEGATVADPALPAAVTGEKTYYAVFTGDLRVYTIFYDLVGNLDGVPGDPTPAWSAENYVETNEFTVAFPDIVLPDPVCDGWAFQGWITNGYDAVLQNPGMVPAGSTTNYTFVADWKEKVTARFVSDGAEYTNLTVVAGESFAAPDAPTKADAAGWRFAFANWVGENGAVVSFPTSIEETTTFTATFTSSAIPYTVVYDLDGGTDPGNPAEYRVTDGTVNLAVATKDYYAFGGWTNRNGDAATAIAIADADENDEISYGATWTPVEFTITYVLEEGATNAAANPAKYTVETPTFTLLPAGKDGFEFVGWVDENGVTNGAPEIALGSHGNRTFTAAFESAAVEPVDPGEAMSAQEKADYPPVAVVKDPVTEKVEFVVHFKGEAGVTYELLAAGSLGVSQSDWENPNGTDVKVVDSVAVTAANEDDVLTLKIEMTDSVKFFKIGARRTGN